MNEWQDVGTIPHYGSMEIETTTGEIVDVTYVALHPGIPGRQKTGWRSNFNHCRYFTKQEIVKWRKVKV